MKRLYYVAAVFLLYTACTSSTSLEVLQPAAFSLPESVQTIVVIDRSKPEKGFLTFLEGAFTGEEIGQDQRGRQNVISGLIEALSRTPRYQVKSSGLEFTGSKTGGKMLPPLNWNEVEDIVERYNADALLVIESYDTDQSVVTNERQVTEKVDGVEQTRTVVDSDMDLRVHVGFRLYEPKTRNIVDEFTVTEGFEAEGNGNNEESARSDLPRAIDVARNISTEVGIKYGMRVAPSWVVVNRTFFTTGKGSSDEAMKRAARYAKADDWGRAIRDWEALEANNSLEAKTRGRAAHNLAVSAEREDRLETALRWAQKAYAKYGIGSSKNYIRVLQDRLADEARLDQQMSNGG